MVSVMERKAMQDLINWKNKKNRKPLLIYGARQVGKTYLVKEFGNRYFEDIIYIEARGHYLHLCGADFEREWKCSFSSVSEVFESQKFFCLRRGFLVNLRYVKRITRSECLLENGETIPVARNKYEELNQAFIQFYMGQ